MERAAIEKGITKKQLVLEAIDLYLHQDRSEFDQAIKDRDRARSEKDQASEEATVLRRDLEHYKETLMLKDDEISFLRAHISQLSEKITPALPPSQEEARAKSWWQFWR
jgi:Lon protease-like protein